MSRNENTTSKQYDNWSGIYDLTFGKLVKKRQRRAIAELNIQPGQHVLDLGIGTGGTLDLYPSHARVIGLDLSEGMLRQAMEKAQSMPDRDIQLVMADALFTPLPDASFDHILITHVISVVSDPNALMRNAQRLVKPGGRIVVLNHFQSSMPWLANIELMLNPLCQRIGWRTDLSITEVVSHTSLPLMYYFKLSAMDVWQIAVFQRPATA